MSRQPVTSVSATTGPSPPMLILRFAMPRLGFSFFHREAVTGAARLRDDLHVSSLSERSWPSRAGDMFILTTASRRVPTADGSFVTCCGVAQDPVGHLAVAFKSKQTGRWGATLIPLDQVAWAGRSAAPGTPRSRSKA